MIFGKVRNVASNLSDNHAAIRRAVSFAIEALEGRQLLSASISGTVVNDYSTAPVPGAQVYLDLQGVDKLVAGDPVVTTDAVGHYSFSGLSAGNYLVRPLPKAGLAIRSPRYAGDYFLQLGENTIATGKDFSIYKIGSPNFTVNGKVIEAITTVGGAESYLRRFNADGSTDITFGNSTDIGGPRGETFLRGVTGVPTAANASGANIVVNYPTQTVTLDGNGQILAIVPVVATGGTISGLVTRYITPPGIPEAGVTVYLDIPGIGSLTAGDPVTRTDAYGQYAFNNVQPGNYLVRIVPPAGTVVQAPLFGAKYFVQLGANQTVVGDDFVLHTPNQTFQLKQAPAQGGNNVVLGVETIGADVVVSRYLASDGSTDVTFGKFGRSLLPQNVSGLALAAVNDASFNTILTFSSYVVTFDPVGNILSLVTTATNVNPPSNVVATALSPTTVYVQYNDNSTNDLGFVIERAKNASGPYTNASVIGPSTYTGSAQINDNGLQPDTTYFYRVAAVTSSGVTAYAYAPAVTTPPSSVTIGASITGSVYFDTNNNGVLDTGEHAEQPAIGRQVYLDLKGIGVFASGDPIATIDFSGYYSFTNLSAGNYLVRLMPQAGSVITSPVYGGKYFVQLAANQHVTGDDFGTQDIAHNVSVTQSDGKLIIARPHYIELPSPNSDVASILTRYSSDGIVDTSYGKAGSVNIPLATPTPTGLTMQYQASQVFQLTNGSTIVVAGSGNNYYFQTTQLSLIDRAGQLVRQLTVATRGQDDVNARGTTVSASTITSDGKILIAGYAENPTAMFIQGPTTLVVWRFNGDLTPDLTFGTNGRVDVAKVIGYPMSVTSLASGEIHVTYDNNVVTLSNTGQLQSTTAAL
jgi:uncharacterized delta-60 repeat protein